MSEHGPERAARRITYRIRALSCDAVATGSGFAVDEHTIVTNRHVVEGALRVQANSWDGRALEVEAMVLDDDHDLAVIRTTEPLSTWVELAEGAIDDEVWVIGFPKGGELSVTKGRITGAVDAGELSTDDIPERGQVWQVSAKVEQGNSGGPLLARSGKVVGVVFGFGAQSGSGYAIQSSSISGILAEPVAPISGECPL